MPVPPSVPPSGQYGGPQQQPYSPPQQSPGPAPQPGYPAPGPGPQGAYQATTGYLPPPVYANPWGFIPPPVRHQSFPTPLQLIPVHIWFKDRSLRNWITILFVVLVVTPSVALYVLGTYDVFTQAAWVFAVYFAGLWLVILWVTVRPPMVKPWMLAEIALIGLVLETPAAMWMEKTLNTNSNGIISLIFTVGLPEETVKALPVLVLAIVHRRQWVSLLPKDYLFLGAVSGLAFGASEAVLYTTKYMPALADSSAQQGATPAQIAAQSIFEGSWRLLTDPISHAIWAGIAGYFIGLAIRYARGRVFVGLFGLGLVAVLHGINDRLAGDWGWIVEVAFSVLLFIVYVQAGGVVEHGLEEIPAGYPQPGGYPPGPPSMSGQYPQYGPQAQPGQGPSPYPGAIPGQAVGGPPIQVPAGYGQWAPAPAPGYGPPGAQAPMTSTLPYSAPPAFNPAGGWGSTGFTQISGIRRPVQWVPPPAGPPAPPQQSAQPGPGQYQAQPQPQAEPQPQPQQSPPAQPPRPPAPGQDPPPEQRRTY